MSAGPIGPRPCRTRGEHRAQDGWAGLKNGALLTRAVAAGFDVFLTVDRNLPKEQKLAAYVIAVVVLRCATNDIADLRKLMPELLAKLPAAKKGEALVVG